MSEEEPYYYDHDVYVTEGVVTHWQCEVCGALVADRPTHDDWHRTVVRVTT